MTTKKHIDFQMVMASSVHDMKNSLSMLLQSFEDWHGRNPASDPVEAKALSGMHYEAARLQTNLLQLLSLYRLDLKTLPMQIEEHFVLDLLEEQVAHNQVLLDNLNIEIVLDCDPDFVWYVDSHLLGGVINNVLVNASRYTKDKVLISAREENGGLNIRIDDNGPGYPKAMLDQAKPATRGVDFLSNSSNLGLYFCQEIASLHQNKGREGCITLSNDSSLGGSRFEIWLP